jgi:heme-degrading monooxygenase HmoA
MLYARLQTVSVIRDPAEAQEQERRLMEIVSGHPGFAGLCLMEEVEDTAGGTLLTLWRTRDDARMAAARTRQARHGPRPVALYSDRIYQVEGQFDGPDAVERPGAAVIVYFDGPRGDEWLASSRFAHEQRIVPVMGKVPGLVGGFALWSPEERCGAVVNLAVSLEALVRAEKAVNSTELLPDEDPAMLTGPDRAVVHMVSGYVGAPA